MNAGGGKISGVRFFDATEAAEMYPSSVVIYRSAPSIPPLVEHHTLFATFIVVLRPPVGVVLRPSCFSKIGDTIIGWYAINVIYLLDWPLSIYIKPSQPMRFVCFVR
jgi:hypothetical protein